ncbi:serine hydrolase [Microbacterium sp. NIBRBAC000506063]|uniref:serine hydrolase n=1 Tax=Microbacterium sp. NIBRBAC000506063 TaxID=2734618 RepID=UPI001BB6F10B|nr:serine hydrolase [Microbacterium sp. NIBRBAC000506063]QTV79597.1 serine hydrolase [Microbacterium sp. NIBRBAC000506063]
MSLRDLAHFMMTLSDNAATDIVMDRVGRAAIGAVIDDLDLHATRVDGDCGDLFDTIAEDLGIPRDAPLGVLEAAWAEPPLSKLRAIDPERSLNRSTPRDITTLLNAIWTDDAASPAACQYVRAVMGEQVWSQRLASGFESAVSVAGKTGTIPTVRNEVGVVTFPDGDSYAVAVFLTSDTMIGRDAAADAAIGRAAQIAVEHLRADRHSQ